MFRFATLPMLLVGAAIVYANPLTRNCITTEPDHEGKITKTCYVNEKIGDKFYNRTETQIYGPKSININRPGYTYQNGMTFINRGDYSPNNVGTDLQESANSLSEPTSIDRDLMELATSLSEPTAIKEDLQESANSLSELTTIEKVLQESANSLSESKAMEKDIIETLNSIYENLKNISTSRYNLYVSPDKITPDIYNTTNHSFYGNAVNDMSDLQETTNKFYEPNNFTPEIQETTESFHENTDTSLKYYSAASTIKSLNFLSLIIVPIYSI